MVDDAVTRNVRSLPTSRPPRLPRARPCTLREKRSARLANRSRNGNGLSYSGRSLSRSYLNIVSKFPTPEWQILGALQALQIAFTANKSFSCPLTWPFRKTTIDSYEFLTQTQAAKLVCDERLRKSKEETTDVVNLDPIVRPELEGRRIRLLPGRAKSCSAGHASDKHASHRQVSDKGASDDGLYMDGIDAAAPRCGL